ncbi:3-methyl-2-oxobutanoate dehydrogenase subunit beta [candidate division KSB1 bacterium]|nr:MAG: 3-methyl-2-oxobutanoate dehydrogenase subunit beta [candidate division KSB1 bacterium]RKY83978.1 MAG: 3-methyl-2-oxobutanoate dehydrogenase subunit beta [candidate division KSB1 bacterium]RKY88945.1 MAG: 3-methyl-2-oxobutanoate dehydrogenase subunit beta [candidate division KSB1 bacterium]
MPKQLIKGNEAVVKGAILAGCRYFFGYPITPASEIAEAAAYYLPLVGGTFLQAESEIASIQMAYGAASGGARVMTASSSPGISLKQEGISYAAGSELPLVVVDIVRGGPGLGNIAPEQGDYNQIVKGGGHGNYKLIVLAPNCAQEMCDLTMLAFELADKYRNPVVILADGFIGQMMEPVEFPEAITELPDKPWALKADEDDQYRLITSINLEPEDLEKHNQKLQAKYAEIEATEIRYEEYQTEDAEIVVIGYGIVSRLLQTVVDIMRHEGRKIGMLRPITLWPFPSKRIAELSKQAAMFMVVELSNGQMVDDVRLAVNGSKPVHFYNRMGGVVPAPEEIYEQVVKLIGN